MHVHHLIVSFFNITMCCSIVWTQMLFYNRVQIKKTIKKTPHHHAHARIGEVIFLYCIFCDLDKSSCIEPRSAQKIALDKTLETKNRKTVGPFKLTTI